MIFDSLNVAGSSLKTNQQALDVISHNIANVNTPGFSRQTPSIATVSPDNIGNLNFGRGVKLQNVQRIIDPIINGALLTNGEQQAFWNTVNTGLNNVENVFGSLQSTGLASALDEFFLAWQQLANNPQDAAQKVNVRATSSTIVSNLNNMQQQLSNAQTSIDAQIDGNITRANQLLDKITGLTTLINRQETGVQGKTGLANDLRDQRDQAVRDLARIVPVKQITASDGSFLIQTSSGDLLAHDNVTRHLGRGTIAASGFASIVIAESGTPISSITQGGKIGGLIELRDNKLNSYMQNIDSIATNLIFSVNQLHSNGGNASKSSSIIAEQAVNAAVPLNDAAQTAPFASQIQSGSFKVHVYDATGAATPPGGASIAITAGVTSMNDVVTSLNNAGLGLTASVDATGLLNITATAGGTVALSDDTSNVLAAYELNTFFHGGNAASLSISALVQTNASNINSGTVNAATSAIQVGDNSLALAILALQDTAMSIDGSPNANLHARATLLSTDYGTDVTNAVQQNDYRTAEAELLNRQRQAISGVNIDEELISMIKFQRAYEASAKVISTTNQMLDSLLGLIR